MACSGLAATVQLLLARQSIQYLLPRAPLLLQMKDWLMEHGHEADVWALVQKKGKKADFEALMRRVTGQ